MTSSLRATAVRTVSAMRRSSAPVAWGSARVTSTSVRMMASGVRSSCEALATKSRCASKAASSRASMPSKVSASARSSSLGPCMAMRSCRVLADARWAATAISCRGRSMRPAISQPRATDSTAAMASAMNDTKVRPRESCDTTWSWTVRMKAATVSWPPDGDGVRVARKAVDRPRRAATWPRNSPGLWIRTWRVST
jgi:hypothetical protein